MKRAVGRPKLLNREHVIDVAFNEYWLHGINNVAISKVAASAGVSRPGIYIEFQNEDTLQAEVLKKYIVECAEPAHKNYDDYKKHPNHLANHLNGMINDDNKLLTDDSIYNYTEEPKNRIGCLLQRSTINMFNLGPMTQSIIKDFEVYRIKQLNKYIINAQNDGFFSKNYDSKMYAEYIYVQFSLIQMMKDNKCALSKVRNMLNASLKPLTQENNFL